MDQVIIGYLIVIAMFLGSILYLGTLDCKQKKHTCVYVECLNENPTNIANTRPE